MGLVLFTYMYHKNQENMYPRNLQQDPLNGPLNLSIQYL